VPQQPTRLFDLFRLTLPLCGLLGLFGLLMPDSLIAAAAAIIRTAYASLDWFFMAAVSSFLIFLIWIAFSRYGDVKLGEDDDQPEFSTSSWIAMLFATGMGVGLLFWGSAEPLMHFDEPLMGSARTPAAASRAMVLTAFHWGLHAWAIYGVVALAIAYFGFRRHEPYLPGSPVRHVFLGRWVAPVAWGSDLLAVVVVAFGVAGSLSMGVSQLQTGLHEVFGTSSQSLGISVGILVALIVVYLGSAITPIDVGIRWLSNINMVLALLLLSVVLFSGETSFILRVFVTSIGEYLQALPELAFQTYPHKVGGEWLQKWTLTYFSSWIAWAPFVGVFIARISRGRTIRQFVGGVLVVPTLISILWIAVFGGTALHEELYGRGGISEVISQDVTLSLFTLLQRLPFSRVVAIIAISLDFLFLVTSADSATFVLGMFTSDGQLDPPRNRRLAWGLSVGVLAVALMLSQNLDAVRSITVLSAVPFTAVIMMQMAALGRTISLEKQL